jgi:hypothetical protein
LPPTCPGPAPPPRVFAWILPTGAHRAIVPAAPCVAAPPDATEGPPRRRPLQKDPAATYSPGGLRPKYHRRWRA